MQKSNLGIKLFGGKFNQKVFSERLDILNLWCGFESVIKWDKGSILKDINSWVFNKIDKTIIHKEKKLKLNLNQIYFDEWTISFVSEKKLCDFNPVICCF